ncbi:MAG: type II 3-dehydroquinate dehydratase [Clostridia bacterium]|nr:type II 3-dehydroquinate dehydratase [Clostridia bacterium]
MKLLVINGANLNMLGIREKNLYGDGTYNELVNYIQNKAKIENIQIDCFQSNHEGEIVDVIQKAYKNYQGIIINAGGYTHTSVVILDALKSVSIPTVEVHITDINKREEFRKFSYISLYAEHKICGHGFQGYIEAIDYLIIKYGK